MIILSLFLIVFYHLMCEQRGSLYIIITCSTKFKISKFHKKYIIYLNFMLQ